VTGQKVVDDESLNKDSPTPKKGAEGLWLGCQTEQAGKPYCVRAISPEWALRIIIIAAVLSPATLSRRNPSGSISKLAAGKKLYEQHCIACHGSDAQGTDRAPKLAGNRNVRSRKVGQLHELIQNGMPQGGMPPFALPSEQLDALATFVRSLNWSASEAEVQGDPKAGERFFVGKGKCSSCHMVYGSGKPIGPDLSSTGSEMTVDEIRAALLHPGEQVTAGYTLVIVQLPDGGTLRGFARNQEESDVELQDLEGNFHLLHEGQFTAVKEEKQPLMPPVNASPRELQDLVAYLGRLTGVKTGMIPTGQPTSGGIKFSRLLNPRPGDWLTYNGNLDGNRYSELKQINTTNTNRLALKWVFSIPKFGLEVTPIVADGIMYVTGPNQAYALDALTGREIWQYSRPLTPGLDGDAALGTNRGVAILGDNLFMITDNAHLIALNRVTGKPVWDVVMPDGPGHYGSTSAPLVVKDMVITGVSGADEGIRGFLTAYKASTGERIWRYWTIPKRGEPGYDTWKGEEPVFGGGSTWLTGSYDRATDTLFWPTGNPWPDDDDRERPGDNLFTDCILALNPDTGKLKWYYQFTPHDVRDWDATEPNVLIDTRYQGQDRKLLLHADRNGFFYVFDRVDGKLLLARKFVERLNWASGIGPDGRPQLLPGYIPPPGGEVSCPSNATNWNATAFSPVTRLYYVVANEECAVDSAPGSWRKRDFETAPPMKYLRALDIETGKAVWEIPEVGSTSGDDKRWAGVLATAGGLLFHGFAAGDFSAVDERDGRVLWRFSANQYWKASPMTFAVDDKQLVAIAGGPNIFCFGLP
jgi:PQQ-dependent dehydrogenase (methanol/ethanol family)